MTYSTMQNKNNSTSSITGEQNDKIKKTNSKKDNDAIQILSVETKQQFKEFYNLSFEIYKNNPNWLPMFWKEFNEFFDKNNLFWDHSEYQLYLAKKGNTIIGRIAAIIDHSFCEISGKNIGFFGFFECIENYACAELLFNKSEQWLASKGMDMIRGPINGRVDMGCGFLLNAYDTPTSLLSTYSPPYYVSFAEQYQMAKCRDLILYRIDLTKPLPHQLKKKHNQSSQQGINIRPFNRWRIGKEFIWWIPMFLRTFSTHWGYIPVSENEVRTRFGIKNLRWHIDPFLFLVAEYQEQPIAYLWATPDYNQLFSSMKGKFSLLDYFKVFFRRHSITQGKLHLIGIEKEFRNHAVGSSLNYAVLNEMKKRGYDTAEVGWIDEENQIAHITIALTGAIPHKKHRVYEKKIENQEGEQDTLKR